MPTQTAPPERVFTKGALTTRRELKEVFWINPRQIQESGQGYVKKLSGGRYEVCCKGQHVEFLNRNGRIYPMPTWARHLMPGAYFTEKIAGRRCVGQVEHPQTGRSSMDKGAIVITKAWIEEDTGILWIVFETMSTPHGKIVAAYLDDGVGFGVSSRGNGSTMNNGKADVVQDDFEPVCWDTVLDESTIGAEIPAEMAMQAESRARLAAWAVERIQSERKKILAESQGDEAAAALLASTITEQVLVECFGGVCTAKRSCSCGMKGVCSGNPNLTENAGGGEAMPKGYNEYLLSTPDETGHYRAYESTGKTWDVWLMAHSHHPMQIATGLQEMSEAKKAAEEHLKKAAAACSSVNEDAKVADKFHVSGSSVYLHQFEGEEEAKKATKALKKAGFLGVEYREEDGMVCIHTGYDSAQQACDHVRRVLDSAGIELEESATVSKKNKIQEVQEFSEELRQAKDADDDIDVPTHQWVGGSMVKPAQNKGQNESARRAYEMGMMAGYAAESGLGEQGGDPAQGYPNDYGSDNNKSASPSMQGYPPTSSPAPDATGGYPGHPGHKVQVYPGFESYSSSVAEIKRQSARDPSTGAGYYEDDVPSMGWPGDKGHPPNVGPTSGQQAGPGTHPLQTTTPGFSRAYEMGMMAGRMQANYGDAPLLYPWSDDTAMMLGYGFEATGHSPPGGPEGNPVLPKEPEDEPMDESGYLGYAPVLDDPEDIDLDLDINDPVLDIDQADTGPSPYDVDSTDTVHGYSEAVLDSAPAGFKGTVKAMEGYTSHCGGKNESTQQKEATMPVLQPAYAFRSDNRTTGSFVKFYFNENHQMVEVREFNKQGTLLQRHGFIKPGSGIKAESTSGKIDPKTVPQTVHETVRKAAAALGNGQAMMQLFAEQAGHSYPSPAAKVPEQPQGVYRPDQLKPDSAGSGSADKAKKDAGGGAPGGSATTSTTQAEGEKKDDDEKDVEKDESVSEGDKKDDDEKDDEKDESRLDPKAQKALQDALSESQERVKTLEGEKDQLTKLIEQMTVLQQKKDVQYVLESVLREHPELKRLKHKLEVCESVESLKKEAKEYLEAIHEASGYRPSSLPGLDESEPKPKTPPAPRGTGRGTAGVTSASSSETSGAPTVGALAEGVASLPALGGSGVNGKGGGAESTSSRVRDYRNRRGRS